MVLVYVLLGLVRSVLTPNQTDKLSLDIAEALVRTVFGLARAGTPAKVKVELATLFRTDETALPNPPRLSILYPQFQLS